MMSETEVKWEVITDLEKLSIGDELEYVCPGKNREFRYWGKVIDIQRNLSGRTGEISIVRMEGDWNILPSSVADERMNNKLTRKVVEFVWPDYVGACVEAIKGDSTDHYVRVRGAGHREWVDAKTGESYATWELEVISKEADLRVLGRGE